LIERRPERPAPRRHPRKLSSAASALLLCALAIGGGTAARAADEWEHLRALRERLQASEGIQVVDFVQTFVPSGFSTGERESGRMSLSLPHCLRWDYSTPYEKSFLVCGEHAYFWNSGDRAGRRFTVDPENEPGLDLLRLQVEELSARYSAAVVRDQPDFVELEIEPKAETSHPIQSAKITLNPAAGRLTSVTYRDREGNTTRFELSGHRPTNEASFAPPDLDWQEE